LGFGAKRVRARFTPPEVPVRSGELQGHARDLGKSVRDFSRAVLGQLFKYRENILFRQYVQERLADAACELYASSCALSRLDHLMSVGNGTRGGGARDVAAGRYSLPLSTRRVRQSLAALSDNDDQETTATADAVLAKF